MPFIDVPLGDAKEGSVVPDGEYEIRCHSAVRELSQSGKEKGLEDPNMTHVMLVIEDSEFPSTFPIHHYLNDVLEDDKDSTKAMKILDTARFLETFDITSEDGGYDSDDIPGAGGKCPVGLVAAEGKYDEKNELRLPRLKTK